MKKVINKPGKITAWELDVLCFLGLFGLWFIIRWVLKLIFALHGMETY